MTSLPFLKKFCQIIDDTNLSSHTKHLYKWRLERLTSITNQDVDYILSNCDDTLKHLSKMELATQISYVNTILSLFKYTKDLKSIKKKSYRRWNEKHLELKESQKKNPVVGHDGDVENPNVTIKILEGVRDRLDKDGNEYFVVSLLTYLPPNIGNLQSVKLYNKLPDNVDDNFWLIEKNGSKVKCNGSLQQVPDVLDNIVRNNLRKNMRKYLIVNKKNKPFENIHGFNVYIDRIVKRVFGKEMNLHLMRRIYRARQ